MKTVLFFFVIILNVVMGCGKHSNYDAMFDVISQVIDDRPDSALALLEQMPADKLHGRQYADYGLYFTEARFKLAMPLNTDTLISWSIDYYHDVGDDIKFGNALRYKAEVIYLQGRKEEAVELLKIAEQTALETGDELLKMKVYLSLDMVNDYTLNNQLALHYAKLMLGSAIKVGDPKFITLGYDHVGAYFGRLGERDSARMAYEKSLKYINTVCDSVKSYILANLAYEHIRNADYVQARMMLLKALDYDQRADIYNMLGVVSQNEGDTVSARKYWEQVVQGNGLLKYKVNALRRLSNLYATQGDYRSAFRTYILYDSLCEVRETEAHSAQIFDIQHRYDHAVMEKRFYKFTLWIVSVFLSLLLLFLLYVFFIVMKVRRLRRAIEDKETVVADEMEQINTMKGEIRQLCDNEKDSQREIAHLTERIVEKEQEMFKSNQEMALLRSKLEKVKIVGLDTLSSSMKSADVIDHLKHLLKSGSDNMGEMMARGRHFYQLLTEGKEEKLSNRKDEESFVFYYMMTFYDDYIHLVRPYDVLPLRLKTYLILSHLQFDSKKIERILSVGESSIRGYRFRINKKKTL